MAGNTVRVGTQVTGVRKSSSELDNLRDKFTKLQKQGAKGFGIGVGAAATTAGLNLVGNALRGVGDAVGDTVQKAASFERGMLNINSIAKVSDADLKAMGKTVLKMSGEFGQSAQTMTDALYDISSSGFAGAKGIDILRAASKAATAGLATTAEAASGITAVLNAYGLSAADAAAVSDVLFKTVENGVVTFPELSAEIGKVTALAAPLGISLEEVGAAISVMTRHGLSASDATTQLNAIMASMLKPAVEAAELANKLGLNWSAAGLKANGLAGSLSTMIEKTGGSEEKMAILLGDVRAIRGAFSLAAKSGEELNDELKIMEKAAGATTEAFDIQSQGAAFKLAQAQAKLDASLTKLGSTSLPAVATAADTASEAFDAVGSTLEVLTGETEATSDGVAALTQGVGSLAANFMGLLPGVKPVADGLRDLTHISEDAANSAVDLSIAEEKAAVKARLMAGMTAQAADATKRAADGMGDAAEDVDKRSTKAYRHVMKTLGDVADAYDDTWSELAGTADQAAEDIFGPMERRAELSANRLAQSAAMGEINKPRQEGESALDFEQRISGARQELAGLQRDFFTLTAEMAGRGELTSDELNRLTQALKEQLKTAANEEAVSILNLIGLLDRLRNKSKGLFIDRIGLNVGSRVNAPGRAHGGPVQANKAYVVGEKGPEALVMGNQSGTIIPNGGTNGGMGSGAAERYLPIIAGQLARLTAREPNAARPQTARGDLARQAALMPGGRL